MSDFISFFLIFNLALALIIAFQETQGYYKYRAAGFGDPLADRLSKIASVVINFIAPLAVMVVYFGFDVPSMWTVIRLLLFIAATRWLVMDVSLNLFRGLSPFHVGTGESFIDSLIIDLHWAVIAAIKVGLFLLSLILIWNIQ